MNYIKMVFDLWDNIEHGNIAPHDKSVAIGLCWKLADLLEQYENQKEEYDKEPSCF